MTVLKNLYRFYIDVIRPQRQKSNNQIIKLRSIVGSLEAWGEQTKFYFWRYSTVARHKLSHFNSRVFIHVFSWNCCRLQEVKKFSRNPGQFESVTEETRYHLSIAELLIRNLQSQVAELIQKPRTLLKILYFSGDHQLFKTSPGIKSQQIFDRGSHRNASPRGTWTGCSDRLVLSMACSFKNFTLAKQTFIKWKSYNFKSRKNFIAGVL